MAMLVYRRVLSFFWDGPFSGAKLLLNLGGCNEKIEQKSSHVDWAFCVKIHASGAICDAGVFYCYLEVQDT